MRLSNTAFGLLLLSGVALACTAVLAKRPGGGFVSRESLIGKDAGPILLATPTSGRRVHAITGRVHVIYVFTSSCIYCERQREHMAKVLAPIRSAEVLSVSTEPASTTANYWRGALEAPLSVHYEWLRRLGVDQVPAVVVTDATGRIANAHVGASPGLTVSQLERIVRAASAPVND